LALTAEYRIMALTGTRTYNATFTANTPNGGTALGFGKFQLGHDLNNTFLFGIRYNFGVTPPPPPAPAPVAAPAPAPARSYLVFFDWDKATLTDRARQIIKDAADNSTRVQYTRIEVNGYIQPRAVGTSSPSGCRGTYQEWRAAKLDRHSGFRRYTSTGADWSGRA
jgi:OmpA-OmpF porin, OOP family